MHNPLTPAQWRRYAFFRGQGSGAKGALALARAEAWFAQQPDLEFRWEADQHVDLSWASERERKRWERDGGPALEGCVLWRKCKTCEHWHPDYAVALWGIVDADGDYRRLVAAELALEIPTQQAGERRAS